MLRTWRRGRTRVPERDDDDDVLVRIHQTLFVCDFERRVSAQETFPASSRIGREGAGLFRDLDRDGFVGPNLPVRMRLACTHHRAAIFEDRHRAHVAQCGQLEILNGPGIDDRSDGRALHRCDIKIVARRKREHPAVSALAVRDEKSVLVHENFRHVLHQRSVIVLKGERRPVRWVALAVRAQVTGAQKTIRIVWRPSCRVGLDRLALPRTLQAARRDEHPLVDQRVPAPMREVAPIIQASRTLHRQGYRRRFPGRFRFRADTRRRCLPEIAQHDLARRC